MATQWLIAKYVPDTRRREPQNVGVILLKDGKPYIRFRGRSADGRVDGRLVREQNSIENYKAWVSYWERASAKGDLKALLAGTNPTDNFFLEFGGERILGADTADPEALLSDLFRQLVDTNDPTESEGKIPQDAAATESAVDRIFRRLDILEKVERDQVLPGTDEEERVIFDFKYKNGRNNWMKRVHLGRGPEKQLMDPLYSAAWVFGRAKTVDRDCHLVALLDCPSIALSFQPTKYLEKHGGIVINVSDEAGAIDGLRSALSLARPRSLS